MENNLENKAKFFAIYLDQEVYCIEGWNRGAMICDAHKLVKEEFYYLNKSFLMLKPLSLISDEDAIGVAEIVCPEMFKFAGNDPIQIERQEEWLTVSRKRNINSVDIDFFGYTTCQNEYIDYKRNSVGTTHAVDYMRSRGYALPFMGLSVEELVNRGWVKLKGETK